VTARPVAGAVLGLVLSALLAVSCSGGSSSSTTTSTRPATTLTSCQAEQLQPTFGEEQGTTGHYHATLILENTSAATCTLRGYVDLQMLTSTGQPLPTSVTQDPFHGPVALVVLHHAGRASTQLTWVEIPVASACVTPDRVQITPPGTTGTLTLPWPPQHNVVCAPAIDSTPLQPGVPRV